MLVKLKQLDVIQERKQTELVIFNFCGLKGCRLFVLRHLKTCFTRIPTEISLTHLARCQ